VPIGARSRRSAAASLKILDVKPIYPAAAREQGLESSVVLEGRIGTDGFVKDLRVVGRSDGDFVNAAVEAISQWQFTATQLDGVPVETNIRITTRFVMQ
jgi:TonB family protein